MRKSKRLLAEVQHLRRQNRDLEVDMEVMRDHIKNAWALFDAAQAGLQDALLLLGKTTDDLPEIREAARAVRYADEHEKNMAVAKDWAL